MAEVELNDHCRYAILRHLPLKEVVKVFSVVNSDWKRCARSAHFVGDIRRFLVLEISASELWISDRRRYTMTRILCIARFLESSFVDTVGSVSLHADPSEFRRHVQTFFGPDPSKFRTLVKTYFRQPRVFVEKLSMPLGVITLFRRTSSDILPNLKSIDIVGGNKIGALLQISGFPQLTNLSVSSVPLSFFHDGHLVEFSQLTSLDVRLCSDPVDNEFVKSFLLKLPNLERLALATGFFLPSLRRCAKLTKLTIIFKGLRVGIRPQAYSGETANEHDDDDDGDDDEEEEEDKDKDEDDDDRVCARLESNTNDEMADCNDLSLPTVVDYELVLGVDAFFTSRRSTIYHFVCLAPNARRFRLVSRCLLEKEESFAGLPGASAAAPPCAWEFECLAEAAQRSRLVALERFELDVRDFSSALDEALAVSFLGDFFTASSIRALRSIVIEGVRFGGAEQIERIFHSQQDVEHVQLSLAFSLHHTENVSTKYERLAAILRSVSASTSLRSAKIGGYVVPRSRKPSDAERIIENVERLERLRLDFRLHGMNPTAVKPPKSKPKSKPKPKPSGDSVEWYEFRLCRPYVKDDGEVGEQLLSVLFQFQ